METAQPTYPALARRVQAIIRSPSAQARQEATIRRRPDESLQDWDRLLEEIRETSGVRVTQCSDGSTVLAWYVEVSAG